MPKYIVFPEWLNPRKEPIVASNFDHKEITSKSGKAPPNPPVRSINPFFFHELFEIVATTVPTAIPDKVCDMMSILFCFIFSILNQIKRFGWTL